MDTINTFSFATALDFLLEGLKIARTKWSENNIYIVEENNAILVKNADSDESNIWFADSEDMLAKDWHIVLTPEGKQL